MAFCSSCGSERVDNAPFCSNCGTPFNGNPNLENKVESQQPQSTEVPQQAYQQGYNQNQAYNTPPNYNQAQNIPPGYEQKSKLAAGLLNIFLGGFGVGRFYLGYTKIGVLQLVVSLITCGAGAIWGLIDGIMILTGNPSVDAQGVPLKD